MCQVKAAEKRDRPAAEPASVRVRVGLGLMLTAAVALLVALDATWGAGYVFAAVCFLATAVAVDELGGLCAALGVQVNRPLLLGGALLLFSLHWAGSAFPGLPNPWALSVGVLAAVTVASFCDRIFRSRIDGALQAVGAVAGGLLYVPLLLTFLTSVRLGWGVAGLLVTVGVCKAGSSGAYFVGKLLGRHKMSPRLSPNKTVEGAVGQFAAAMVVSVSFSLSPLAVMGPAFAALYGAFIAAAALVGDLAASLLKREAELKDWGALLPGFGGMMDMLDDVLFAAPVSFALLSVYGLFGAGG